MIKSRLFKVWCVCLALVLSAGFFALAELFCKPQVAYADTSNTFIKSGYSDSDLAAGALAQVSTKGVITAQFNSSFTASEIHPNYVLTLKKDGNPVNFLAQTKFSITNYSGSKDDGYVWTNAGAEASVNLSWAVKNSTAFSQTYTVGASVQEKIQIQVDFSRTTTEMTAGNYQLILTRSGTALSPASFTLSQIHTTFSIENFSGRPTLYSNSFERFGFDINYNNTNNIDTAVAQMGRGIKVTLRNSANTETIPWPTGTLIVITDNNNVSRTVDVMEHTNGVRYAFNTSGVKSQPKIDINIPNGQDVLANGTYKIKFELFVEGGELPATASKSITYIHDINYLNVDYTNLNVKTMIKSSVSSTFNQGIVFYVNRPTGKAKSVGLAFDIEFNQVPNDAKIQYVVEERSVNGSVLSFSEIATTKSALLNVGDYIGSAVNGQGLGCGHIFEDSAEAPILTAEGVYRFRIDIYDRNYQVGSGGAYLKKTCYAYFVCVDSTAK